MGTGKATARHSSFFLSVFSVKGGELSRRMNGLEISSAVKLSCSVQHSVRCNGTIAREINIQ